MTEPSITKSLAIPVALVFLSLHLMLPFAANQIRGAHYVAAYRLEFLSYVCLGLATGAFIARAALSEKPIELQVLISAAVVAAVFTLYALPYAVTYPHAGWYIPNYFRLLFCAGVGLFLVAVVLLGARITALMF